MSPTARAVGVSASSRRHPRARPLARWDELTERVADALARRGAPHPRVAASLLAARGLAAQCPEVFAACLGVDPAVLDRAEHGELALEELPPPLRRVADQL